MEERALEEGWGRVTGVRRSIGVWSVSSCDFGTRKARVPIPRSTKLHRATDSSPRRLPTLKDTFTLRIICTESC